MLTLICGIPNSGKTTFSKRYQNVIHLDEVSNYRTVCDMVAKMDDVCVEGIYIDPHLRKDVLKAYKGDRKVCIFLDTPLKECIAREERNRGTLIIKNCHLLFIPPTYDEGWDEIIVLRGDNQ